MIDDNDLKLVSGEEVTPFIDELKKINSNPISILEIGAGDGSTLSLIKEQNPNIASTALEPNLDSILSGSGVKKNIRFVQRLQLQRPCHRYCLVGPSHLRLLDLAGVPAQTCHHSATPTVFTNKTKRGSAFLFCWSLTTTLKILIKTQGEAAKLAAKGPQVHF